MSIEKRVSEQEEDPWRCLKKKIGLVILTLFPSIVFKKELTECIEREEDPGTTKENT